MGPSISLLRQRPSKRHWICCSYHRSSFSLKSFAIQSGTPPYPAQVLQGHQRCTLISTLVLNDDLATLPTAIPRNWPPLFFQRHWQDLVAPLNSDRISNLPFFFDVLSRKISFAPLSLPSQTVGGISSCWCNLASQPGKKNTLLL